MASSTSLSCELLGRVTPSFVSVIQLWNDGIGMTDSPSSLVIVVGGGPRSTLTPNGTKVQVADAEPRRA